MNTVAQRIALYAALGLVLSTAEITVFVWQFWAMLALFWTSEYMVRKGTEEQAMADGISAYLDMPASEQNKIKQIYQKIQEEQDK
jgi:hypothetical protein